MGEESNEDDEWEDDDDADVSSNGDMGDNVSDVGSLQGFDDVETKSHFTNYSMTSSVMRRSEGLTLLDDRFERLFAQYEDGEMGPLEHEEIAGTAPPNSALLNNILDEFEEEHSVVALKDVVKAAGQMELEEESESDTELHRTIEKPEPGERWDCESILSTYSNLYNHPKKIVEPKKSCKPVPKKIVSDEVEDEGICEDQDEDEFVPAST